jgi:hypothetical protein
MYMNNLLNCAQYAIIEVHDAVDEQADGCAIHCSTCGHKPSPRQKTTPVTDQGTPISSHGRRDPTTLASLSYTLTPTNLFRRLS